MKELEIQRMRMANLNMDSDRVKQEEISKWKQSSGKNPIIVRVEGNRLIVVKNKKESVINQSPQTDDLANLQSFIKRKSELKFYKEQKAQEQIQNLRQDHKLRLSQLNIPNSNFLLGKSRNTDSTKFHNTERNLKIDQTNMSNDIGEHIFMTMDSSKRISINIADQECEDYQNPDCDDNQQTFQQEYENGFDRLMSEYQNNSQNYRQKYFKGSIRSTNDQESIDSEDMPPIRTFKIQEGRVIPMSIFQSSDSHKKFRHNEYSENSEDDYQQTKSIINRNSLKLETVNLGQLFQIKKQSKPKAKAKDQGTQYYAMSNISSNYDSNQDTLRIKAFLDKQKTTMNTLGQSNKDNSIDLREDSNSLSYQESQILEESERNEQSQYQDNQKFLQPSSSSGMKPLNLSHIKSPQSVNQRYLQNRYSNSSYDPVRQDKYVHQNSDLIKSFSPDQPLRMSSRTNVIAFQNQQQIANKKSTLHMAKQIITKNAINKLGPKSPSSHKSSLIASQKFTATKNILTTENNQNMDKSINKSIINTVINTVISNNSNIQLIKTGEPIPKGKRSYADFLKGKEKEQYDQYQKNEEIPLKKPPSQRPSMQNLPTINIQRTGSKKQNFKLRGKNF
ncbi:UNKNOWN [Stylonychia lemnae]|uniref:Uncharacterized protein n=1 Tax=Stylonychia lemnae TaxID=5949 RepID=A0A078AMP0_STYLE|nr:UNKNOWN [Stylonychia lemnae]|eukprot:CDW83181.1 UNKNOWN [Stylonychia lemnae]